MTIQMSPCTWPVSYSQCSTPTGYALLTADEKASFETMATDFLWRWTGRTLGVCEVEVSPCRREPPSRDTFHGRRALWLPVIVDGQWFNISCGSCLSRYCYCLPSSASIRLPGPVDSIISVTVHGVLLPETAYKLQNHRYLVRLDGFRWPVDPDDWTIVYRRGVAVPIGGQVAAGVLAIELWKAQCGDKSCGLPQRVQSITRQGVTMTVLDSFDDIDTGHTGIWLIDSWVTSMMRAPAAPRVYSPDLKHV